MDYRKTSINVPEAAQAILAELGSPVMATLLWRLLEDHHRKTTTGDEWVGTGIWQGYRITTAHVDSVDGRPVLVGPDGRARWPGNGLQLPDAE